MTDYIEREAAIAAMSPMLRDMISRGKACDLIRAIPSAPSQREAAIRERIGERIGEVRLFLDTGFLQLGVTIDYDPADIFKTLQKLDAILALLDQPAPDPVANAAGDVLTERQRQISAEGWTPGHDDEHTAGELAQAAACYAELSTWSEAEREKYGKGRPPFWPLDWEWWKPTNRRRDLVKAGALILAEIERLDRAALVADAVAAEREACAKVAAGFSRTTKYSDEFLGTITGKSLTSGDRIAAAIRARSKT